MREWGGHAGSGGGGVQGARSEGKGVLLCQAGRRAVWWTPARKEGLW